MVVLKEIIRKDYLKGTKALQYRHYFTAAMIGLGIVISIPLYFKALADKPKVLEKRRLAEEADRERVRQIYALKAMLYEELQKPENRMDG